MVFSNPLSMHLPPLNFSKKTYQVFLIFLILIIPYNNFQFQASSIQYVLYQSPLKSFKISQKFRLGIQKVFLSKTKSLFIPGSNNFNFTFFYKTLLTVYYKQITLIFLFLTIIILKVIHQ